MVVERVIENIRECIVIDMLFVFMPERGATGAIFITRLLQVKFLDINNNLCFALIDLEKTFNRVPLEVLWWVVHVIDVPEWIVHTVTSLKLKLMYRRLSKAKSIAYHYSFESII